MDNSNIEPPAMPELDSLAEQMEAHVRNQLSGNHMSEPLLADGAIKKMKEFMEQLAEHERNKKCGDPDTIVESNKMDVGRFCTVCRKCELEWGTEHKGV